MAYPQDYSIDNALNDLLVGDSKVTDVYFTESGGVIKETAMSNGGYKVEISEPVSSSKGHFSGNYYYDFDGNYTGYKPHNG